MGVAVVGLMWLAAVCPSEEPAEQITCLTGLCHCLGPRAKLAEAPGQRQDFNCSVAR